MTRLAIALLNWFVLRRARDILMTGETEPSLKRLKFDSGILDLMTVVTVAVADRWVDHLSEQPRICRAVLGMATDTLGCDRIVLMRRNGPIYYGRNC